MKLRWLANTILFLLLLSNGLILWITYKPKEKFIIDINDKYNQQYFYDNYKIGILSNDILANDSKVFFGCDSLSSFPISKLLKTDILFFRFSGNFCEGCNNFVIKKLADHFDDFFDNDKIILLGTNINPRLRGKYYGKELLSYRDNDLGLPFEKSDLPVMFILGKDRKVKLTFLPDKTFPGYFDSYLRIVKEKLFNQVDQVVSMQDK